MTTKIKPEAPERKTVALAKLLRYIADMIDPQPYTIEMLQLSEPVDESLSYRGVPVYYWKTGERSVSFYPAPDRDYKFLVRCAGCGG